MSDPDTKPTTQPGFVPVSLDPCLAKREQDEPMFILLGRDSVAPEVLDAWCELRAAEIVAGTRPDTEGEWDHIAQVREKMHAFREWRAARK